MVWNAVVVIVTACVTLVALREGVRITLIRELDQLLQEDLKEIEIALSAHEDRSNAPRTTRSQRCRTRGSTNGSPNLIGQRRRACSTNRNMRRRPASGQHQRATAAAHGWRVASVWRRPFLIRESTIRVGASLNLIRADIARLDRFVALAACGVLVVAPLCGYWLAGRATRPLAKIIATTARLRPSQLNERLEIRGTGDELDQLSANVQSTAGSHRQVPAGTTRLSGQLGT